MYKLIGGDQKEYGPVSFDQLAQWVRDNRANAQTLVQKEGGPWLPLGTLPEFASILADAQPAPAASAPAGETLGGLPGGSPAPQPTTFAATQMPIPSAANAREMVQGPATALLVTGILCVIAALVSIVGSLMGASFIPEDAPIEMQQALSQMSGPLSVISSLIGLAISGLVIFASQKMRNLESFGLVVTATILAMIPCTSPCCCIGLPIGIWVLVILFKPEVKNAFR